MRMWMEPQEQPMVATSCANLQKADDGRSVMRSLLKRLKWLLSGCVCVLLWKFDGAYNVFDISIWVSLMESVFCIGI